MIPLIHVIWWITHWFHHFFGGYNHGITMVYMGYTWLTRYFTTFFGSEKVPIHVPCELAGTILIWSGSFVEPSGKKIIKIQQPRKPYEKPIKHWVITYVKYPHKNNMDISDISDIWLHMISPYVRCWTSIPLSFCLLPGEAPSGPRCSSLPIIITQSSSIQ